MPAVRSPVRYGFCSKDPTILGRIVFGLPPGASMPMPAAQMPIRIQMDGHDGSTIVTLYRPDMLQVRVDVRFQDIPNVSLGQPVQIENPALSSPLMGKVLSKGSEADIQKNTREVKVEIPSPPPVFKPEMLVQVMFLSPAQSAEDQDPEGARSLATRIYLPQHLIRQDDGGSFVWLADQSAGVARKTPIVTGLMAADGLVEITSGLTISSRVIASGGEGLQDGDRIRVTGEESQE